MATTHKRKLITRKAARETGLDKFYTGKQCPNGHRGQRYTASNKCVNCTTDVPVISEHLLNMAKAQAKIKGIKIQTYSTTKEIAIINSCIPLDINL